MLAASPAKPHSSSVFNASVPITLRILILNGNRLSSRAPLFSALTGAILRRILILQQTHKNTLALNAQPHAQTWHLHNVALPSPRPPSLLLTRFIRLHIRFATALSLTRLRLRHHLRPLQMPTCSRAPLNTTRRSRSSPSYRPVRPPPRLNKPLRQSTHATGALPLAQSLNSSKLPTRGSLYLLQRLKTLSLANGFFALKRGQLAKSFAIRHAGSPVVFPKNTGRFH